MHPYWDIILFVIALMGANFFWKFTIVGDEEGNVESAQAIYWFRKAAEHGDAKAQNTLAHYYINGKHVTQDSTLAAYWFQKSAEQNFAPAQNALGFCYENGYGVQQDSTLAAYWYQKAGTEKQSITNQYNTNETSQVLWFSKDISTPFNFMSHHIAHTVYKLIHLTNDQAYFYEPNVIHFATGEGTRIVWGCTGLKQSFIWIIIMLVARGQWKHKLWFIPLGLLCTYLFNILRITLIAMAIENHPEWFHLLHDYIFKYLFYAMLFGLWLWWTHRIAGINNNSIEEKIE